MSAAPLVFSDPVEHAISAVFDGAKDAAISVPIHTERPQYRSPVSMKLVLRSKQITEDSFNLQIALTTGIGEDPNPEALFANGAVLVFVVLQNLKKDNGSWFSGSLLRLLHALYQDKFVHNQFHKIDPWWNFARKSLERMVLNPHTLKTSAPGRELSNPGGVEAAVQIRGGAFVKD
jgi:hypothetical protein